MDAIDLLRNDHRRLMRLATQLRARSEPSDSGVRLDEFIQAVRMHKKMEEELLYPELEEFDDIHHVVDESSRHHLYVNDILDEMSEVRKEFPKEGGANFVTRLIHAVEQHISHDEKQLLPRAEVLLRPTRRQEMFYDMDKIRTHQSDTDSLIYPASRIGPKL